MQSKRLDLLLVDQGHCATREQAQRMILAGEVWNAKGQRLEKPGDKVPIEIQIEIRSRTAPFASRAGHKLEFALERFGVNPNGLVCLDVGASTGGFTDCLLKRGAAHVFSVDVGYGQIDVHLRNHSKVTVLEKCNARYLTLEQLLAQNAIASFIQLIVVDVSFISLSKIVEPLSKEFASCKNWVLLFKPQFEVGQKHLAKGGVVKSPQAVEEELRKFDTLMQSLHFQRKGIPESSPLTGKKSGNLEYLLHYERLVQK